jgi:hypothetical protein
MRRDGLSRRQKLAIFRHWVAKIGVETNGRCNRTCWFCPNRFLDRRADLPMSPEHWEVILRGLHDTDYSRLLVWSRYSEPLADRAILERVAEARAAAPQCRVVIYSNGDYLDAEYVRELAPAGVNRLVLGAYLPEGAAFSREEALRQCTALAARCGAAYEIATDTARHVGLRLQIPGLAATVACQDYGGSADTSDRGGALAELSAAKPRRFAPCYLPSWHLLIDHSGAVMPCCHLRSDYPDHVPCIVARLGSGEEEVDLVGAYARLASWRRTAMTYGPKEGPCAHCTVGTRAGDAVTRLSQRLALGLAGCSGSGLGAGFLTSHRARRLW